jgi:hypothetical protein
MTPELYHSLAMCFLDETSDCVKEMTSCVSGCQRMVISKAFGSGNVDKYS